MLDASGIIHIDGDRFLVAEDETDILRYFSLDMTGGVFEATGETIDLGRQESDFESLAYDRSEDCYYCIGSHHQDYSRRLWRFNKDGSNAEIISFNAEHLLDDVNIESLSVWKNKLLIGYRSPSRNGLALAVVFDTNSKAQLLTSFDLEGRVFRDMVCINDDNYLILAGPERGKHYKKQPPRLYWWNGDLFNPELGLVDLDISDYRTEGIATRLDDDGQITVLVGTDESAIKKQKRFQMLYCRAQGIDELLQETHQLTALTVKLK